MLAYLCEVHLQCRYRFHFLAAQVLACFNDNQVNVEDIHLTREMVEQYEKQQAAAMNANS